MPADLIRRLGSRAQGNPFYLEELLNYLHDRAIDPYDSAALATLELPDSLHRLILSRLDQLSTQQQALLKCASVIGRRFLVTWLAGAFTAQTTELLPENLRALEHADLTTRDSAGPELAYLFKHVVTQECAYTSLSEATRGMLHEQIAIYLEALPDEAPERLVDLLAYHYDRTANLPKRRFYLRRAGEAAAARFAHDAALDYFTRALALAPEDALPERYELLLAREALLDRRGDRAAQLRDLDALTALAHTLQNDARSALILTRQANYALVTSDYPAAIDAVAQAAELAGACGATAALIQAHRLWGRALHEQCHYQAAREHFQRSLELAQASRDRRGETQALDGLGMVAVQLDDYADAHTYHKASLQIAQALGDRAAECTALNQLGQIAMCQGDYTDARRYFEQGLQIVQAIGDRRLEAINLRSIGVAAYYVEDFDTALACYTDSLTIAQAIGDRQEECSALCNLGLLASRLKDSDKALAYYERSLDLSRIIGDRHSEVVILNNLAGIFSRQYQFAEARKYYEQSLQVVRAMNNKRFEALILGNLGDIATNQGEFADAYSYLQKGLDISQAIGHRTYESFAMEFLGILSLQVGDFVASKHYLERLSLLVQELSSRRIELLMMISFGEIAFSQGMNEQAQHYYEQSFAIFHEVPDGLLGIKALLRYGFMLLEVGDCEKAEAMFQQALSHCHELNRLPYVPVTRAGLALVALARSDLAPALEHVSELLATLEQCGLDGISEPLQVLVACYEVLARAEDERAAHILALAYSELQRRALTLPEGEARQRFNELVLVNRRILRYVRQHQSTALLSVVSA
jgi:tetratricopeptide (TPR) repeat protein